MSEKVQREDSRMRKDSESISRGDRPDTREEDTVRDDISDLIRSEFLQEALPQIAAKDGWHPCWLSTTSAYDPIHRRMRLGYLPVKLDDPLVAGQGLDTFRMTSGQFEGCVSCNEMLLFKIQEQRYQQIMNVFHHQMPAEAERAIKAQVEQQEDEKGRTAMQFSKEDDGFSDFGRAKRVPTFA